MISSTNRMGSSPRESTGTVHYHPETVCKNWETKEAE